ncbi:hypothetical protein KsCSTR_47620 [Candidatus Kuenenia stuttgartiensis]|uniref:Uncharacterized protein n=1 Tax=Kuenenia stuttgartiensis TaxID=174633 RepID=A0A6G7GXZ6_KUEST|nr:hypothetical protein KsCSTR_47620 [Candidatus Kuenenia stuttgartiensis]
MNPGSIKYLMGTVKDTFRMKNKNMEMEKDGSYKQDKDTRRW